MYFDSFQALLHMDGHGPYVWAAYGITLSVMLALVWTPIKRQRDFFRQEKNRARREQRISDQAGKSSAAPQP